MPDNTNTSTEADTVEIKQEITSSNSTDDKLSSDNSPASITYTIEEDKMVNKNEVKTIEVTEITTTTSGTGAAASTTKKVIQRVSSVTDSASSSKPGTPKKTPMKKQLSLTNKSKSNASATNVKSNSTGTPKLAKKNTSGKVTTTNNNTKVKTSTSKPSSAKKPTTKISDLKRNNSTTNSPKRTQRNRSASPKKSPRKAPNKTTSTPVVTATIIEEKPTQNGMAFEIMNNSSSNSLASPKKRNSRKPVHVASVRPPKIQPRARSPIKSPKKVRSTAWR